MEWKEVTLGELGTIVGGATPSTKNPSFYDGNIPWLTPKDLSVNSNKYILRGERNITEAGFKSCSCKILPKGSVLFSSRAPIGYVAIAANDMCTNQGFKSVIPNEETDSEFLYYLLKYNKDYIASQGSGTTFAEVSGKTMKDIEVVVPKEKEDQRRIASILSSLDRKIELNNKINADLEKMAQAIFKNWFVDFEPFKDGKFVDSELGMIPEGWKVSQIADIPHILETGKRPKGGAVEKGIPSVGAEHVKGMCAYDYSKTKYINCEFATKLKTGKINGYELMIYKDGGKPGYFIPNFSIFGEGYPFENCYLNEHVFKLDFNGNKEFNIFCYFFFKTEQIMSYFNAQGAKAAIPGINKKDVENIYIFSPDNESVIKFGEFAYPLFKQMLKNAIENRTLSLLRDTLLPRLMSGEIEVPE